MGLTGGTLAPLNWVAFGLFNLRKRGNLKIGLGEVMRHYEFKGETLVAKKCTLGTSLGRKQLIHWALV